MTPRIWLHRSRLTSPPPPDAHPGLTLELERLGSLLDESVMLFADVKLAKAQADIPALESRLRTLSNLTNHAAKTVTALRARERSSRPQQGE